MSDHSQDEHHGPSAGTLIAVWCTLVALTGITVSAAGLDFGDMSIYMAMLIATLKVYLVVMFFMHIRYEKPLFRIMILVAIVTLAIIISLTFADVAYRGKDPDKVGTQKKVESAYKETKKEPH